MVKEENTGGILMAGFERGASKVGEGVNRHDEANIQQEYNGRGSMGGGADGFGFRYGR